jgi:hypothetical protein
MLASVGKSEHRGRSQNLRVVVGLIAHAMARASPKNCSERNSQLGVCRGENLREARCFKREGPRLVKKASELCMVRTEGLEPSRGYPLRILSPVRLPVSPRPPEGPQITDSVGKKLSLRGRVGRLHTSAIGATRCRPRASAAMPMGSPTHPARSRPASDTARAPERRGRRRRGSWQREPQRDRPRSICPRRPA